MTAMRRRACRPSCPCSPSPRTLAPRGGPCQRAAPRAFLEGPWPSVAAPGAEIAFRVGLPEPAHVRARLVAASGRRVLDFFDEELPAGVRDVAARLAGPHAPGPAPGVYILVVDAGRERFAARLVLHR